MVRAIRNDPMMCRRYVYLRENEKQALEKYADYVKVNPTTILKYIIIFKEKEFVNPDNKAKIRIMENMSIPFERTELIPVLVQIPRYIAETYERYLILTKFNRSTYYRAIVLDDINWMVEHVGSNFDNVLYSEIVKTKKSESEVM